MCGIAGYSLCRNSCQSDSQALLRARDAMQHRGPDDFGVFEAPVHGVGLVHTRLSILDLSPLGHQPMTAEDGRVVLVFNGEIYNFRELRSELEAQGVGFRGTSDTEVLLQYYLAWGHEPAKMLCRLNGIFAFAVWDARSCSLLLARDPFGVKPLYFGQTSRGLAFASEVKALMPLFGDEETARCLDADALNRYLSFLWCPGSSTPLAEVRKLGPGEFMRIQHGQVVDSVQYYRLPVARGIQPTLSEDESIRGCLAHLRTAVHRQMVADVPVGAFLSGGLDSSSIVALAKEVSPDIHCFTIDTPGGGEAGMADDLPYARKVAAHLGVTLEVVTVDSARMAAGLQALVAQLDEPLADPAPLNVLFISQLARERGIKVLLSGTGGDDLFTGYRRHRAVALERYWTWLPRPLRLVLEKASATLDQRRAFGRRVRKLFNGASLSADARLVNYFVWSDREDLMGLYSPEFRDALQNSSAVTPMLEFLDSLPRNTSPLDRMLGIEQRFFLTDHNLAYTDKMSMAAGIEVRVPFLDLDLVEFAARVPMQFKQRGAEGKWVLKKAMEPLLPHDTIYRPKTGFGVPLRRWMRVELRELLADGLSAETLRRRGLFSPVAVSQLIAANDAGLVDASYTLLSLLCIELWCRRFIDIETTTRPNLVSTRNNREAGSTIVEEWRNAGC